MHNSKDLCVELFKLLKLIFAAMKDWVNFNLNIKEMHAIIFFPFSSQLGLLETKAESYCE